MSQVERVLALLRSQGARGLNTSSLQEIPVLDGGAPILRLAARIQQLKDRGFTISSRREGNKTSTYFLVGEPERALSATPDGGAATDRKSPVGSASARSAAPAEAPLFDSSRFTEQGGYRDTERAA